MTENSVPIITSTNYAENVSKTEVLPTTDHTLDGKQARLVKQALRAQVHLGGALDAAKRMVFYGKPTDPDRVLLNWLEDPSNLEEGSPVTLTPQQYRLLHCVIGIASEASEICEQVVRHIFEGAPFDKVNFGEELGDIDWYQATGCNATGLTLEQVMTANIAKLLHKRYTKEGKFSQDEALKRNLVSERATLESILSPASPEAGVK